MIPLRNPGRSTIRLLSPQPTVVRSAAMPLADAHAEIRKETICSRNAAPSSQHSQ